ncbi:pesticidal protein Cry7Aa [Flavobacterium sp.]|uniref:glycoside hydrolase family 130 protein n=1 Tax=Flavobacterium sp. TaxID=239 RepID=UPI0026110859|nr:pesticidal protein Cry7Aa [Flavobacterium sp.]
MITVKKKGIILEKTNLDFENGGVLNPAVIKEGNSVHLFYRAVSKGNFSSIGYCELDGPVLVKERRTTAVLSSEYSYESQGLEDPRLVKIEDTYFLTYTAYNGVNALGALALSSDLIHFKKQGIIVPQITYQEFIRLTEHGAESKTRCLVYNEHNRIFHSDTAGVYLWDKNLIFFPRKINDKLCFLHRIKPDIQIIVEVNDLKELTYEFWQHYFLNIDESIVLSPKYKHESSYIGGGCPPIETAFGWLIIYHGVQDSEHGYIYSACAALLDLKNPRNEIARLPYALFKPDQEWELKGEVNNVCFPTGTSLFDDTLYIYYGAADERIAVASISISELLKELMNIHHEK